MIIFDGIQYAHRQEPVLAVRVGALRNRGVGLTIAAILFAEDAGSRLYTRLKSEAASRVGIGYQVHEFSLNDPVELVQETIERLGRDPAITGIIVQKPWRKTWIVSQQNNPNSSSVAAIAVQLSSSMLDSSSTRKYTQLISGGEQSEKMAYAAWWSALTSTIELSKDVDGLHPETLQSVQAGTWQEQGRVLPATAQAVLNIVRHSYAEQSGETESYGIPQDTQVVILGQSDIVGKPLYYELKNKKIAVEMMGSKGLQEKIVAGVGLKHADVVITATGHANLITGELLKPGVRLIDVGEPQPDVDRESLGELPVFITPVPGGVGPVTVVCLLENCVNLNKEKI
jgi:methylenetetrahydrofolate dehydrogenase (NADP+) / methenyltetrahydrofolate cyclohydrolase